MVIANLSDVNKLTFGQVALHEFVEGRRGIACSVCWVLCTTLLGVYSALILVVLNSYFQSAATDRLSGG